MDKRSTSMNAQEQYSIIADLVQEAASGETKVDVLPNTAQPLHGEIEAMYFKAIRNFFENVISKRIMTQSQDLCEGI